MRLFLLACLLFASAAKADDTQILFEPKQVFPAQGGPAVKVASFASNSALLVGGCGRLMLKNVNLGLGIGGYSLATELLADVSGVKRDIGFSYGGVMLDRSFFSRRLFYFNVNVMAGMGQAWAVSRLAGSKREHSSFYVVEPEITLMLNVTREIRLGVGVGYRSAFGRDLNSELGMSLDGPAATLTLLYGKI